MSFFLKKSDVIKNFPRRATDSHKGQNGRVLIIGGSLDYFGAPILAGLGAAYSGADLVHLLVPECNFEVTRGYYPDFIVRKYPGNFLNERAVEDALMLAEKVDAILIGPGIGENPQSLRAIIHIIGKARVHCVLDAEGIPALAALGLAQTEGRAQKFTITPNRAEFAELLTSALPGSFEEELKFITDFSTKWNVNILFKGARDIISAPNCETAINETGNPGMTVGGTGDIVAGVTASLIAQHADPFDAACSAAFVVGAAGDMLLKQKGYNFIATDVALELPYTIASIIGTP